MVSPGHATVLAESLEKAKLPVQTKKTKAAVQKPKKWTKLPI